MTSHHNKDNCHISNKNRSTGWLLFVILILCYATDITADRLVPDLRDVRAVHMGGNWGGNRTTDFDNEPLPADYIDFLNRTNINWVGISVALKVDNSIDSTVELFYAEDDPDKENFKIYTFTDSELTTMVQTLHSHGIHVYLTLAIEIETSVDLPVARGQLGDPARPGNVLTENWPWAPDHPSHSSFIAEFWQTYSDQAVHFATLAESLDVEMFSLGTETVRLFRTRSGNGWPNHFRTELTTLVSAVRSVYSGLLTYDMSYEAVGATNFAFGTGSDYLWQDLGLDVIGISAYFPVVDSIPTSILPLEQLENGWRQIFNDYLEPLSARNPGLPIMFLEFGYTDSIESPFDISHSVWEPVVFYDGNTNGLDDGQETQANVFQAMFNVNKEHGRLISGTFIWEHNWMSDEDSALYDGLRGFWFRDRLAETVVSAEYATLLNLQINAGFSGTWYNKETPGQGVLIDVEPEDQFIFLAWFTYTPANSDQPFEQHWFTAQGNYTGNKADLVVYETLGGKFDDAHAVNIEAVGTATVSFADCGFGWMNYAIDTLDLSGSFPLQRAIPGSDNLCQQRQAMTTQSVNINGGMDGAWFDPGTPGQGFLIDAHPDPEGGNFIFVAWFTYGDDTASGQRWLTAQGSFSGSTAAIDVYETTGGSFDDTKAVSVAKIGTMTIDFQDCSNALLSYELTDEALQNTIAISRGIPGGQALCEELNAAE